MLPHEVSIADPERPYLGISCQPRGAPGRKRGEVCIARVTRSAVGAVHEPALRGNAGGGVCDRLRASRRVRNYPYQFSTKSPSTRLNSLTLRVTSVPPAASAVPAISVSRGPMGVPLASSPARTFAAATASARPSVKVMTRAPHGGRPEEQPGAALPLKESPATHPLP